MQAVDAGPGLKNTLGVNIDLNGFRREPAPSSSRASTSSRYGEAQLRASDGSGERDLVMAIKSDLACVSLYGAI
jgi:hypothetical protein